jgi:hypothetical protein
VSFGEESLLIFHQNPIWKPHYAIALKIIILLSKTLRSNGGNIDSSDMATRRPSSVCNDYDVVSATIFPLH